MFSNVVLRIKINHASKQTTAHQSRQGEISKGEKRVNAQRLTIYCSLRTVFHVHSGFEGLIFCNYSGARIQTCRRTACLCGNARRQAHKQDSGVRMKSPAKILRRHTCIIELLGKGVLSECQPSVFSPLRASVRDIFLRPRNLL